MVMKFLVGSSHLYTMLLPAYGMAHLPHTTLLPRVHHHHRLRHVAVVLVQVEGHEGYHKHQLILLILCIYFNYRIMK